MADPERSKSPDQPAVKGPAARNGAEIWARRAVVSLVILVAAAIFFQINELAE